MASIKHQLTEDEGTFLSLLVRAQPATAYQLSKIYAESPVTNIGTSNGKIYPLIERLQKRGLIHKRRIGSGSRGSPRARELLEATRPGEQAVRNWAMEIKPSHLLPEDPLRTRIQSFNLLTRDEQLQWVVSAKLKLHEKLAELEAYTASVTVPFKTQVHDNAVSSLRCRMDWLDRLLAVVVNHEQ